MEQLTPKQIEIPVQKTLVSVVIPTKNRAATLPDTLHSILAGTYQNFELIVVDQSNDEATFGVVAEFATDQRLHYYRNERAGATSSRNLGVAFSQGELIAFTDDDVTVTSDWLERIVAAFEADPELQFICGKLTAPPFDWDSGFTPSFNPDLNLMSKWRLSTTAASANFSLRRELMFNRVGGFDELTGPGTPIGGGDDVNFFMRVIANKAKYKPDSSIEVIHTHGFRAGTARKVLQRTYQIGMGYACGRIVRQGILAPGLWFLQAQLNEVIQYGLLRIARGQRPIRMGWLRDRFVGFWRGFWENPREGRISPSELAQLASTKKEL